MADNTNDEYEYADLDMIGTDPVEEGEKLPSEAATRHRDLQSNNIKRNSLIVIGLVILAMVLYKILGSFYSTKKVVTEPEPTPAPVVISQPVVQPQPVVTVQPAPVVTDNQPQITQKIAAIELSQQNVREEVSTVSNQLSGISTNVNDLTSKIEDLNQTISALAAKVEEQSNQLAILNKPKVIPVKVRHVIRRPVVPSLVYYINAVIPGRAWLIATNGSTLTVREGSIIAGYGIVKLIDPNQGRVITSSGRVIRFSPQDS